MKSKDIFTFRDAEKQAGPVAFSTMLKPAGSACNLDCHYCYYLDKAVQYGGRQAVMSDELLELYVKQYICANEVDTVQFCWHGGEPLLLGVDFYRRAMEFQRKYADGNALRTPFRPTARWSTRRGATCSRRTIFWWASRSTVPKTFTTLSALPKAASRPSRASWRPCGCSNAAAWNSIR